MGRNTVTIVALVILVIFGALLALALSTTN
jgi:hypothetical protein